MVNIAKTQSPATIEIRCHLSACRPDSNKGRQRDETRRSERERYNKRERERERERERQRESEVLLM